MYANFENRIRETAHYGTFNLSNTFQVFTPNQQCVSGAIFILNMLRTAQALEFAGYHYC